MRFTDEYKAPIDLKDEIAAIFQEIEEVFQSLFDDAEASGDQDQVEEVQEYMLEEIDRRIKELGDAIGRDLYVEYEYKYETGVDLYSTEVLSEETPPAC